MSYTILMDAYKYLKATSTCTLYAHENIVDTLYFIIPKTYSNIDLGDFVCTLTIKYSDNSVDTEILTREEEVYKENYYRYPYVAKSSNLTKLAGKVTVGLKFNHTDLTQLIQYSLTTSTIDIPVLQRSDVYNFSDDSLEKFDEIIGKLDTKIQYLSEMAEELQSEKVDDLKFDSAGTLHVSSKGQAIGTGVDVAVPSVDDSEDGTTDGLIDFDEIYKSVTL